MLCYLGSELCRVSILSFSIVHFARSIQITISFPCFSLFSFCPQLSDPVVMNRWPCGGYPNCSFTATLCFLTGFRCCCLQMPAACCPLSLPHYWCSIFLPFVAAWCFVTAVSVVTVLKVAFLVVFCVLGVGSCFPRGFVALLYCCNDFSTSTSSGRL